MARTLNNILIDVNSSLDLEASAPTGDELSTRVNYANQAVWDAAMIGQLPEFKKEFISTATLATMSLPSDYHEPMENPRLLDSTGNWREYELIEAEEKYQRSSKDRYAYVLGDSMGGRYLIFNNLLTNATLSHIYQRYPSGLATLSDVCELSDPQYVARRTEAYVLYARSDDRFPIAEQKSEAALANMMGRGSKGNVAAGRRTMRGFKNPLKKS